MNLTKKMGPLPVWAWGLILGIGGYYLYSRHVASSSTSSTATSPTAGTLDPNAIDPNTGLTYGQEEGAALNANSPSTGGLGSTGDTTGSTGIDQFDQDLQSFLQAQTDLQALAGLNPNTPAPVTGAHPPSTKPSAHYASTIVHEVTKVENTLAKARRELGHRIKSPRANAQATRAQQLLKQARNASSTSQQQQLIKKAQDAANRAAEDAAAAAKHKSSKRDTTHKTPAHRHRGP